MNVKFGMDPLINTETHVFYPFNDKWEADDVDQNTNSEEWKTFMQFIEDFYSEEESE